MIPGDQGIEQRIYSNVTCATASTGSLFKSQSGSKAYAKWKTTQLNSTRTDINPNGTKASAMGRIFTRVRRARAKNAKGKYTAEITCT